MQTENKFFEDLAKMMNGAAGTFAGMTREAEASAREKVKSWLGGEDFVSRKEFEAVKAMAAAARNDADALAKRLNALESGDRADAQATAAMPTPDNPPPM